MDGRGLICNEAESVTEPVIERLYLVTAWVSEARPVFGDFLAGRLLVDVMRQQQHRADTWAFLVMPDYLSWFVQLCSGMSRYKLIEAVLTSSSVSINRYLGISGEPLWRPSYHCQPLGSESAAKHLARQALSHPVRSGLVESIGAYPLWDAPRWF